MKKLIIGVMTLAIGASLFAVGPNFVDKNGDEACDTYVSRGNKTAYEAGASGTGQYRSTDARMSQRQQAGNRRFREEASGQEQQDGYQKFREEAPGQGRNRK